MADLVLSRLVSLDKCPSNSPMVACIFKGRGVILRSLNFFLPRHDIVPETLGTYTL